LRKERDTMNRRLRLQLRAGTALFRRACDEAAKAFGEGRYRDALAVYEQFAVEHPGVQTEQLEFHIHALKDYIENHVDKMHGQSNTSASTEPDTLAG
jgi:hypothetical protein